MNPTFVSSLPQLESIIASNNKSPLVVGGELVYISIDKAVFTSLGELSSDEGDQSFVLQSPRQASRQRLFGGRKKPKQLHLSITRKCADYLGSYKGVVAFSADHYLAYGLSLRKDVIVIGGGDLGDGALNLELFVFKDGELVEAVERNAEAGSFQLGLVLDEFAERYHGIEMHWCDPLPELEALEARDGLVVGEGQPFKTLIKAKVSQRNAKGEEAWGAGRAAGVALVGAAVFAAATGFQWHRFDGLQKEYQQEIEGYAQEYNNSVQSLDLLRQREHLMSQPSLAKGNVELMNQLIAKVSAMDGVVIHSVKVFSEADPERSSVGSIEANDFKLDVSIPQARDVGARDQAEPILAFMNQATGMTLRVLDHREDKIGLGGDEQFFWRYVIGGKR